MRRKLALLFTSLGSSVLVAGIPSYQDAMCKTRWDDNWDHRQPENLVRKGSPDEKIAGKTSTAKRTIYLVRHGQYQLEEKEDKNKILTTLGRQQAECTGNYFAKLGIKFSNFTASTMNRANETGKIIYHKLVDVTSLEPNAHKLEFERSDLLREGYPMEAVPYHKFRPDVQEFTDGCRIEAAFRSFLSRAECSQNEDSHEIIVCHANVIRYFVCRAMQQPPEGWLRMSLANGSITEIVLYPNGHVTVLGIGEKGHIPVDMITYT